MLASVRNLLRHLLRHDRGFATGAALVLALVVLALISPWAPNDPADSFVVPPDIPPGAAYWFGTNSRGQDMFWLLAVALRNTFLFGLSVALASRLISLAVGLSAGYFGGWIDRVGTLLIDTFIAIPMFPVLVLFYFMMKDHMSWTRLVIVMAFLGWAYDARLIRSIALGLRTREFTRHAVFAGMSARQILVQEHLPYVLPVVFSTTMNNMIWSIGLEITLAVLGFADIDTPTIGTMLYWANQHSAMTTGIWWWIAIPVVAVLLAFIGLFLLAVGVNEYIDPRSRLDRLRA
jgi:peptide/nickel transport system permease protein